MPLTSVEERLFAGLADQAGLVLRGARLRAELEQRAGELSARAEELRASRGSAWSTPRTPSAGALERDIHDGAQQHLVALAVNLRLAQTLADRSPERADALLADQEAGRGGRDRDPGPARPAASTRRCSPTAGWPPRCGRPSTAARCRSRSPPTASAGTPPSVEAAAYFCCLEALQNAAKHSGAIAIRVDLRGGPTASLDVRRRGRRRRLRPDDAPARQRAGQHARPDRVGRTGR